jgi:hypothetical protein
VAQFKTLAISRATLGFSASTSRFNRTVSFLLIHSDNNTA